MNKDISSRRLLVLQAAYLFVGQLGTAVLFPYLRQHFSFAQISLQAVAGYMIAVLLPLFISGFKVRRVILGAIIITGIKTAYTAFVGNLPGLYLYAILAGLPLVYFWIPYEILYFKGHDVLKHGKQSAWYFAVFSGSGIIIPLVAGFIADRFGFHTLFYTGAVCMIIPLLLARKLPDVRISVKLSKSLKHLRGVIPIIIFDGLFWSITPGLVALSLLTFTTTAIQFGGANSLVAAGALIASMLAAHYSDRKRIRAMIIYPLSIMSAFILVLLGLQKSLLPFMLLFLVFTSVRTIALPINNAVPMDLHHDHAELYMARQFLTGVGRVLGFGLTWAAVLTVGLFPMYVIYALVYLIYIFIVRRALKAPVLSIEPLPLDG